MDQHSKDAISNIRSKLKDMRARRLAHRDEPAPEHGEPPEHKPAVLEVSVEKHSIAPPDHAESPAEESAESPSEEASEKGPELGEPKALGGPPAPAPMTKERAEEVGKHASAMLDKLFPTKKKKG